MNKIILKIMSIHFRGRVQFAYLSDRITGIVNVFGLQLYLSNTHQVPGLKPNSGERNVFITNEMSRIL